LLELDCCVVLRSFNGTETAPTDCDPAENYWRLIGESGTVIEQINQRKRVLVQFNRAISSHGLHCHNPIKNSLYILESDLENTQC
jgi:hypothetical protein